MKTLIIYDSVYGNTEKIAKEVRKLLNAKIIKLGEAKLSDLEAIDLLIIGSPTHGGRATPALQEFINKIPADGLKGIKVNSFDTGIPSDGQKLALKMLIKVLGYASPRIVKSLESKGGKLIGKSMTFMVKDKEGPILEGEMNRVKNWVESLK